MLKIKGETFYLFETGSERYVFNTEQEAIDKLKEISRHKEPNPEETLILKVNPSGQEWDIQQVPWSKIAIELL